MIGAKRVKLEKFYCNNCYKFNMIERVVMELELK